MLAFMIQCLSKDVKFFNRVSAIELPGFKKAFPKS